jgi:hypothetical protein
VLEGKDPCVSIAGVGLIDTFGMRTVVYLDGAVLSPVNDDVIYYVFTNRLALYYVNTSVFSFRYIALHK